MDIFNTMKLELSNAVPVSQKMLISITEGSNINLDNIHLFSTVPPPTVEELLKISNLKKEEDEDKYMLMNLEDKIVTSSTGTNNKYLIKDGIYRLVYIFKYFFYFIIYFNF